jgi:hypothetical protein
MFKLKGEEAKFLKSWINVKESIVEVDGEKYLVTVNRIKSTVLEDVDADPELKQSILRAKRDIAVGNVHTTDELIEMIDLYENYMDRNLRELSYQFASLNITRMILYLFLLHFFRCFLLTFFVHFSYPNM